MNKLADSYRSAARGLRRLARTPVCVGAITGLIVFASLAALRLLGALEPLELMAYDASIRARAAPVADDGRIAEIGVTEADIERFGWPLSDALLAQTIEKIAVSGARVIGVDIFRPTPVPPGSQTLDAILAATRNVIWATRFGERGWAGIAAPKVIDATDQTGFADLVPDADGIVRRGLLYLDNGETSETSFSARLAFQYLAKQGIGPSADPAQPDFLRVGRMTLPPLDANVGAYVDSDDRGYQFLLDFRHGKTIQVLSLGKLLDAATPPAVLKDRIVVVGVAADSVRDSVITPLEPPLGQGRMTFGVTVHALAAAQLVAHALDGVAPTWALEPWLELVAIALLTLAGGQLGAVVRGPLALGMALVIGTAAIGEATVAAFSYSWWLPGLPAAGGWIAAGLLTALYLARGERIERAMLMRLFAAHVSPAIANEVWNHRDEFSATGRPVPKRLSATMLFSDITGFTTISERLDPVVLEYWLNAYIDAMVHDLVSHDAVIERFAGDGIMSTFGVPIARTSQAEIEADARAALRCALAMRDSLDRLNARFRTENLPLVRIGIGVSSGRLVAGSIGGADRLQYTVTGDAANVAARLVEISKEPMRSDPEVVCRIVVSEATQLLAGDEFTYVELGERDIRGKAEPVRCFLLVGAARAAPA